MAKVDPSYFIAKHLRTGKAGGGANGVMVRVATASVIIGLTVMIFALAIIFGFKKEISGKLTGALSHIQITHYSNHLGFDSEPVSADQPFLDDVRDIPGIATVQRYAYAPGILRGEDAIHGIVLKGVGDDFDWAFFRENLQSGELPVVTDSARNRDVLVSALLARKMKLALDDRIELMFMRESTRRDQYRIKGIYETGLNEVDDALILTDVRNVQRINRWSSDEVSGYEMTVSDFAKIDRISDEVYDAVAAHAEAINDRLMVVNIKDTHPMIFDWLETHDLNALIIIVIMLLVAVFNMIAAMLIIILEKTSMVGILKTLGMPDAQVQKIFVIRSSSIILRGMLWGNIAGITLCLIQKYTGILTLNAEGYFLSVVPVSMEWGYILLLNVGVFAVILLLMFLTTMVVSRIVPEKTIRYE